MSERDSEESKQLIRGPALGTEANSASDTFLRSLTDEQRRSLGEKLGEKLIETHAAIDAKSKEARLLFETSSADMDRTVEQIRELENASKTDYELNASYRTASGETKLRVSKSNNMVIIVIAIAIVIGLFLILSMAK